MCRTAVGPRSGSRRLRWLAAAAAVCSVWVSLIGRSGASGPGDLVGSWTGEGLDGPVEARFEADGRCQVGSFRGTYKFIGAALALESNGRMELVSYELSRDRLWLATAMFPDGVELERLIDGRPAAKSTQVPDAERHSPDSPRVLSPDGRCSFIVPPQWEAEWFDRPEHGEMVFRIPGDRSRQLAVRVGRLDRQRRDMGLQPLLQSLVEALAPEVKDPRPASAPEQGQLWRWPARSVELRATGPAGQALRGWTAVALVRPLYVHLVALGPEDGQRALLATARKVFHDLRVRPGERSRERELELLGLWRFEDVGSKEETIWFGRSGNFRWKREAGQLDGRFQVRARSLLLHWGDAEKELQVRAPTEEAAERRLELSGRPLLRLGPGD